MIDLVNAIILAVCSFIAGAAVHSLWRHAKDRGELENWRKLRHKKAKK